MAGRPFISKLVRRSCVKGDKRSLRIGLSLSHYRNLSRCPIDLKNPFIKVSEEVREAVNQQKPVVALETTIYTHGGDTFPPELLPKQSHML